MNTTTASRLAPRHGQRLAGLKALSIIALFFLLTWPVRGSEPPATSSTAATRVAPQATARQIYEQAQKENNLFYLARAKATLEEGLKRFPDDWRLNRLYIAVARRMSQTPHLIPYYTGRIAREPGNAIGYAGAALVNFQNGEQAVGEEFLKKAREISPASLEVLELQACWPDRKTREAPRKVTEAFERLLKAYPDYTEGRLEYLSRLRLRAADRAQFKRVLAEAKEHPQQDPAILSFEIELVQNDTWYDEKKSIAVYERILARDPARMNFKRLLAEACGETGDAAREEQLLKEITLQAPEWFDGWRSLAQFYADHQQYDLAGQALLQARDTPYENPGKEYVDQERAEYLIQAGKFEAAIALLREIGEKQKGRSPALMAASRLTTLLSRKPGDRIYRLPEVPYLVQRGAYCGPASLSMTLGYWGVRKSQEEIAAVIYTGIAGTAAQTIQEYCTANGFECRSFQGDVPTWKRVLDQGVPILWLKYQGFSGHYVVVTGYDDLTKEFMVHNPWRARETRVRYDEIDDEWLLPNLRLSLAIYPRDKAAGLNLVGLAAPLTFRALNTVTYLTTGSNLFRRFLPGILLNLAFMAGFILLNAGLIALTCHPCGRGFLLRLSALHFGAIAVLGFIIHEYRFTQGVSLFVAHQASLIAAAPLLLVNGLLTFLFRKRLTATQAARLNGALLLAFASIGWMNWRQGENLAVPAAVLGLGVALSVYELWIVLIAGRMKTRMNYTKTIQRLRKYGSARPKGRGMLEAWMREAELEKRRRNFGRAQDLIRDLLGAARLGKYETARLQRMLAECLVLQAEEATDPETGTLLEALRAMAELKQKKPGRLESVYLDVLHARALLLRGDKEQAHVLCQSVQARWAARDFVRLLQRGLQFLRGRTEDQVFYSAMHVLNRLDLARAAGDREEAALILNEARDFLDLRYMQQTLFEAAREDEEQCLDGGQGARRS